jgi:hypothetical protein
MLLAQSSWLPSWGSFNGRAPPAPHSSYSSEGSQHVQATDAGLFTAVTTYLDTPLVAYADPRELLLLAAMVDAAAERTEKVGSTQHECA